MYMTELVLGCSLSFVNIHNHIGIKLIAYYRVLQRIESTMANYRAT